MQRAGFMALIHLAWADVLERTRRASFLAMVAVVAYLGYTVNIGFWTLRIGNYQAAPSSAWAGAMTALLGSTLISWLGFYLVRGSVDRDRRSGMGQILAATPMGRGAYVLGKAASNLAVLGSLLVVLAVAAVVLALIAPGSSGLELGPLLTPFLLCAVPAIAVTAAAAVFFECTPGLRGGIGNLIYFFLWVVLFTLSMSPVSRGLEPTGFGLVFESQRAALLAVDAEAEVQGMGLQGGPKRQLRTFTWEGLRWTPGNVVKRCLWLLFALLLALAAALPFDRFDPAREARGKGGRRRKAAAEPPSSEPSPTGATLQAEGQAWNANDLLSADSGRAQVSGGLARLGLVLRGELQLMLRGSHWLWLSGLLGLTLGQILAPLEIAVGPVVTIAMLWPLIHWSSLGCQARAAGLSDLLDSAPQPRLRQVPAAWFAGCLLSVAAGSASVLRLAVSGEGSAAAAVLLGLLIPPTLALALGTWSGTSRLFQVFYLLLWYLGPLSGLQALNFLDSGLASGTGTLPGFASPTFKCAALLLLLVAAVLGRDRRP